MILMIDNYDSFVYNIVQYLGELKQEIRVFRNNEITLQGIADLKPSHIFISPGPCSPSEAGISLETIREFAGKIPVFGVCLGHQSIGQVFGGRVIRAGAVVHGKVHRIFHDGKSIFSGLPSPFHATRYHSLIVERKSLPDCLEVSAWTEDGLVMGLRHKQFKVEGVQFHPESVLTEHGHSILKNFLS
ncbi:MAG: aminodeoxychorismate/anthranilate synthase component II [Candidatus Wallbacteria bacterium]|nr:aminodeoxychorismate/anthranilate synthase component II [Candidatus Wallbacteria bacterium]